MHNERKEKRRGVERVREREGERERGRERDRERAQNVWIIYGRASGRRAAQSLD